MGEGLAAPDLRVALEALRDRLIVALDAAEPREVASLARQLEGVLVRLNGLVPAEKSSLDDLADARSRRRAAVPESPGAGVKRGKRSS